ARPRLRGCTPSCCSSCTQSRTSCGVLHVRPSLTHNVVQHAPRDGTVTGNRAGVHKTDEEQDEHMREPQLGDEPREYEQIPFRHVHKVPRHIVAPDRRMPGIVLPQGVGDLHSIAQLMTHQSGRYAMDRITGASKAQTEVEIDAIYEEALVI